MIYSEAWSSINKLAVCRLFIRMLCKIKKRQWRRTYLKIDGVFSGGGIKGLAFLGACQVLEERGFHFNG